MEKIDIIQWVKDHKTRILGYATIVLGTLTTLTEQLREILSKREMALFVIVVGVTTALFGHLNASKSSDPPAE